MKVKAKIVLNYCRRKREECEYTIDTYGDFFEDCDDYMKHGDSCSYYGTKEIYIDKEYKDVSIEYQDYGHDIRLNIGRKTYVNDCARNYEIEYLYLDDKVIIEDYKIVRENVRESF